MESGTLCHKEWFDLKVVNGVCFRCRSSKPTQYQPSNKMYLGPGPQPEDNLPKLTQMEDMFISPIHA